MQTLRPVNGERTQRILDNLFSTGMVSVQELADRLEVSPATVRRDLELLEREGRLRRTHGGAIPVEPLLYEPFRHDSSFQEQIEQHAVEKRRIAMAAAETIAEGDTIALTSGTTTTLVARSIPHRRGVTVVTASVNVAMELSQRPDLSVFVTGGYLRGSWFSLVGQSAIASMSQIFVDKVFIGVNGIHPEKGLTTFNHEEAAIDRTMIRQAGQKIAVADHSKLGVVGSYLTCTLNEIDILFTDTDATDEVVDGFLSKGLKVRRV
jgi:DeoR family transcriptional regulator, aga operon transcriptional repressor